MKKRNLSIFVIILIIVVFGIFIFKKFENGANSDLVASDLPHLSPKERGAFYFSGDAWGGLSLGALKTHAIPWKITTASLIINEQHINPNIKTNKSEIDNIFQQFGFLKYKEIANFPKGAKPIKSQLPTGMVYGNLLGVQMANIGCSSCHSGVSYNEDGTPNTDKIWLGSPNTSLNLEAYIQEVYNSYIISLNDKERLLKTIKQIYPETTATEMFMIKYFILPQIENRMKMLAKSGRALPFPSGSPGVTNGVAALKLMMKLDMDDGGNNETGFTSIPDLGDRAWRSSMLYDGAYAPSKDKRQIPLKYKDINQKSIDRLAIITSFFSVPSMGVSPNVTHRNYNKAKDVYAFLKDYHAPKYPAKINMVAAKKGEGIYGEKCASCHGYYNYDLSNPKLVQFPNWIGDVGTDKRRAQVFNQNAANAVNSTIYKKDLIAKHTGEYVGTPLSGIWQSAPYLHNGSVPTIDALLNPSKRPKKFMTGGHSLDFVKLGIKIDENGNYPANYKPWSKPEIYETTKSGMSNSGHDYGSELTPDDQKSLIEYLKLL